MAEESKSPLPKNYVSAANRLSSKSTKTTATALARFSKQMTRLGHLLAGTSALGAALLSASGLGLTQLMESQAFSTFYQLRGSVMPPEDIVILAIDDQSTSTPAQSYQIDPKQYAYFEPLQKFPYKREAYAQVIDKLIKAGARSVALDVVFDRPNLEDTADDQKLQQSLQRYGDKVALGAVYEFIETYQGKGWQLSQPSVQFRTGSVSIGSVNLPVEVDGKIHRFASEFPKLLAKNEGFVPGDKIPSFGEAVLRAANVKYARPKGDRIYFYGSPQTFEHIPFWYVLDPENWNSYLQQGKIFKDKIVLIGATNKLSNDYHSVAAAPSYEQMAGVEIHANAIATLMQGKAIAQPIKNPFLQGLFVLALVGGCALIVTRNKRGIIRFLAMTALATIWGGISYSIFIYNQLILPTTVPMMAMGAIGLSYLGTEVAKDKLRKSQLVNILQKHSSNHLAQEIISMEDDLQDLLQQREKAIAGKILDGRYKIVKVLGSGGFSETYIAEDTRRPQNPLCVVKQLKPGNTKSESLEIARRLFKSEAQTLEKLGTHPQIPQLLAYFEEDEEFYLIQEYIIGHPLNQELPAGKLIPEPKVIEMLRDLLQTLAFVHDNGVIHRDIKPSNIMRRDDNKLVLIDFGAVKEVTTQLLDNPEQTAFTIGIGTKGYAPSEQCFGRPQYSSDIYAVGMIGIKALTGKHPHELDRDADGELKWLDKAKVSHALAEIFSKMVLDDFKQRYQSASLVLEALDELKNSQYTNLANTLSLEDTDTPTISWVEVSEDTPQPPSSTSIVPQPFDKFESKN
ncbi:CHASE2 domain-containing protein [Plectonema radiosum NIES-515]|uniref:non-specific serine/threonine protein kinase n=1 Tax=Plectonema radiosum NIES-515 TaxID=2986073 RepID=A0ABT3AY24_9CYAN|nr:CHASE2 domain-containing protein [Plectonema radiosum]MCV3213996.1 CHASE2 domain-containing protein [Plectonema radiosum NIES-515]